MKIQKTLLMAIVATSVTAVFATVGPDHPVPAKSGEATIAFYNLENLFDTEDDPRTNDNEFMPDGSYHWTEEDLQVKLDNLSRVISELGDDDGPEVLGVCEVENLAVLEMLTSHKTLKKHGYGIIHHDSPDQRGIDCALLYKKKEFLPLYSKTYPVVFPENPDMATRDILLVKGIIGKEYDVTFVVNHWSSRRGGEDESSFKRERAASVVRHVVDSIQALDPYANIVIMGDFNDEPTNPSMLHTLRAARDSVQAAGSLLYNCMYPIKQEGRGTLKFRGHFNLFDQMVVSYPMLLSNNLVRYKKGSANIYNPEWMTVQEEGDWKGAPKRTHISRKFHADGFSDHFPVYLTIEYGK